MPGIGPQQGSRALRAESRKYLRLCSLAAEIAKLGDRRSTLQKIVKAANFLIGVQAAHLALIDKQERTLYGVASSGRHPPGALDFRIELSRLAAARDALKRRKPIAIESAEDNIRVSGELRRALSIGGVAYLPLLSGRQSFGLLILVTRRPHAWTGKELRLAQLLANFASVALENARLLKRLAETETRFKNLVEHIPAIVYLCDFEPPYRSTYVSPQIETMFGYPSSEWMNDPNFWMRIMHPDDVVRPRALHHEMARSKGVFSAEYRIYDRSGEIRWVREEAVLVRDPAGAPIGWHGVFIEITGIKSIAQGLPTSPARRNPPYPRLPQA